MKTWLNFIGGAWVPPAAGAYRDNVNPADTRDVIGRFPLSDLTDVTRAVASAQRGFQQWRRTPAPARGDVLRRVGELLSARKEELADLMTREMGKPLAETRGDVQEGIDTAFYAATEGRRLFGHTVPSELASKWAMSFRRPIGVAGLITPFNFPLAIPTWKAFPALVCGNAVVLKPAEDVPHTATVLVEILLEAGLPPEVIQLVHGEGEAGQAIVEHPGIGRQLNLRALRKYLQYEYVPSPHSMIDGVHKLRPGHRLIFEKGGWRTDWPTVWQRSVPASSTSVATLWRGVRPPVPTDGR